MLNIINISEINKEFDLDLEISYGGLKKLRIFAADNNFPQGYLKQIIIHSQPADTFQERLLKEIDMDWGANEDLTILLKEKGATNGFKFCHVFIFSSDEDEIRKMFKYYKLKAFI